MNRKAKGSRNERRSRRILEAEGYAVTRDWPGKVETAAIRAFRAPRNARKVLHRWRDGVNEPDVRQVK